MELWIASQPVNVFTYICPPIPYPLAVEKHHEHEWPPLLPPQHPVVRLKSGEIEQPGSSQIGQVYGARRSLVVLLRCVNVDVFL